MGDRLGDAARPVGGSAKIVITGTTFGEQAGGTRSISPIRRACAPDVPPQATTQIKEARMIPGSHRNILEAPAYRGTGRS